jgi:hypothetical protein
MSVLHATANLGRSGQQRYIFGGAIKRFLVQKLQLVALKSRLAPVCRHLLGREHKLALRKARPPYNYPQTLAYQALATLINGAALDGARYRRRLH